MSYPANAVTSHAIRNGALELDVLLSLIAEVQNTIPKQGLSALYHHTGQDDAAFTKTPLPFILDSFFSSLVSH